MVFFDEFIGQKEAPKWQWNHVGAIKIKRIDEDIRDVYIFLSENVGIDTPDINSLNQALGKNISKIAHFLETTGDALGEETLRLLEDILAKRKLMRSMLRAIAQSRRLKAFSFQDLVSTYGARLASNHEPVYFAEEARIWISTRTMPLQPLTNGQSQFKCD